MSITFIIFVAIILIECNRCNCALLFSTTDSSLYINNNSKSNNPTVSNRKSSQFNTANFDIKVASREEWLAKEYFQYLCAPLECMSEKNKTLLRKTCYEKHEKLLKVIKECFPPIGNCLNSDERSLLCAMEASKSNPSLIPLELHDCVDGFVTIRLWKCIRRKQLEKVHHFVEVVKKKQTNSNTKQRLRSQPIVRDGQKDEDENKTLTTKSDA